MHLQIYSSHQSNSNTFELRIIFLFIRLPMHVYVIVTHAFASTLLRISKYLFFLRICLIYIRNLLNFSACTSSESVKNYDGLTFFDRCQSKGVTCKQKSVVRCYSCNAARSVGARILCNGLPRSLKCRSTSAAFSLIND